VKATGRLAALLLACALAACAPEPQPAHPALWRVQGPHGENAWLFGTIHALDRPALWRSGKVDGALKASDRIVVEVGNLADAAMLRKIFAEMSRSDGLPPLSQRVAPALRPRLAEVLRKVGARETDFAGVESWAVALSLARASQNVDGADNGIDRAVVAAADKRPVIELEGAAAQLGIFDRLPAKEQADLLDAVLRDAGSIDNESESLAAAWRKGDMAAIEAETGKGLLADPELREALFVARNRAWVDTLGTMLARGEHPFVAVGAAHMAGPQGLPAMLAAKGFKVTRVQ
jgi:uncharacterized protein YbaP (TraB family)